MELTYNISNSCLSIIDSYQCKSTKQMKEFLNSVRENEDDKNYLVLKRSNSNLINEWGSHNLCYSLHIARERTKTVDLEYPQSIILKIAYGIVGTLYKFFH